MSSIGMYPDGTWVIIILPRGFVVVGQWYQQGRYVEIKNGGIVRRWGTSKGLGELAEKGPLGETIIDKSPPMRHTELVVVLTHLCDQEVWQAWGDK